MGDLVAKVIKMIAIKSASINANSACTLYFYQPKESDKIKQLRKF